jgi:thiol reductant ABC exporter CydC subunit
MASLFTTRMAWLMAASVTAGAGTVLAGVGLMASSGFLVSRASQQPPIFELTLVFVAVRFFGLARPALRYVERLASHELTFRVLLAVRSWFIAALLPLSQGQLAGFRSGDLLSRMAADVETLQDAYLRVVAPMLVALVTSAVVVTGLAFIDGTLAFVVLALLLFHGGVWSWVAARQARAAGARNLQRRALSADLVALVQGLDDVLAFGHEGEALRKFDVGQRRLDGAEREDGRLLAGHVAMGTGVTALAFWCALAVTLHAVGASGLPVVWIAALVLATVAAFESVEGLPAAWQFAGHTADSARRVLDVVHTRPAVTDHPDVPPAVLERAPAVEFDGVTFGYGTTAVLHDVSLHIGSGEHVGIAGATGAGKSTLLTLLMRGWDPSKGRVTLDGMDLRGMRLEDLRQSLAVWPQLVHIFNSTLRDNVRLARPTASDRDVTYALERAELVGFLNGLPQGLDTMLGEFGARMSAGERQRLGFARILLTDAPLVLVDEPTAYLDSLRARRLLATLRQWARSRTMLVVSHSPAALNFLDRVMVVSGGRVTASESATSAALLDQ